MRIHVLMALAIACLAATAASTHAAVTLYGQITPSDLASVPYQPFAELRIGEENEPGDIEDINPNTVVIVDQASVVTLNQVFIGYDEGFSGALRILGQGDPALNATVNVLGGSNPSDASVVVGRDGDGYLEVNHAANLILDDGNTSDLSLATDPFSHGSMLVDNNSFVDLEDDLTVGHSGVGHLTIAGGSLLRTTSNGSVATLGLNAGSAGYLAVTDSGSKLELARHLTVGAAGIGELIISNGARVVVNRTASQTTVGPLGRVRLYNGQLEVRDINVDGQLGGHGVVRGQVDINPTGDIEVYAGQELTFHGPVANAGSVTVSGGQASFLSTTATTTAVGGSMTLDNGTVRFGPTGGPTDFTNAGVLASAGGVNHVHGVVTNTGTLVVARDSVAVFHDTFNDLGTTTVLAGGNALFQSNVVFTNLLGLQVDDVDGQTLASQVHVAGDATLGGSLAIAFPEGYNPQSSQSYELLHVEGGIQGQFIPPVFPQMEGVDFGLNYGANTVMLDVLVSVPSGGVAGDFNEDGMVDARDYSVWRQDYAEGLRPASDFEVWLANYGANVTLPAPPAPEPATALLALVLLGSAGTLRHRGKP